METILLILLFVFICLLILVMFFFLKRTVIKINQQSKDYFVDKLQAYDNLINEKEKKLNELNKSIEEKNQTLIKDESNYVLGDQVYLYNQKNIDYYDEVIFKKLKKIENKFNIDSRGLIKRFIVKYFKEETVEKYNRLVSGRKKFSQDVIYDLVSKRPSEQEEKVKELLGELVWVLDDFKKSVRRFNVLKFISYFDRIISVYDPYIYVYVGDKNENYDGLHKFVKTVVDENIFKGVSIIYRGKVYDYSLK